MREETAKVISLRDHSPVRSRRCGWMSDYLIYMCRFRDIVWNRTFVLLPDRPGGGLSETVRGRLIATSVGRSPASDVPERIFLTAVSVQIGLNEVSKTAFREKACHTWLVHMAAAEMDGPTL